MWNKLFFLCWVVLALALAALIALISLSSFFCEDLRNEWKQAWTHIKHAPHPVRIICCGWAGGVTFTCLQVLLCKCQTAFTTLIKKVFYCLESITGFWIICLYLVLPCCVRSHTQKINAINQVLHTVGSKETQQFFFHQSNKNVWKWLQMESKNTDGIRHLNPRSILNQRALPDLALPIYQPSNDTGIFPGWASLL